MNHTLDDKSFLNCDIHIEICSITNFSGEKGSQISLMPTRKILINSLKKLKMEVEVILLHFFHLFL